MPSIRCCLAQAGLRPRLLLCFAFVTAFSLFIQPACTLLPSFVSSLLSVFPIDAECHFTVLSSNCSVHLSNSARRERSLSENPSLGGAGVVAHDRPTVDAKSKVGLFNQVHLCEQLS
jgi:hypothetical protein